MPSSTLFIDQQYLIEHSVIDDTVDFKKIKPVVFDVQMQYIRPMLGTDLYNQIATQIDASPTPPYSGLSSANALLLNEYVSIIQMNYVTAQLAMVLKFRFTNSGLQVRGTDISQSAETGDVFKVMDFYKNKAETHKQLMIDYIRANQPLYPAFFTANNPNSKLPDASGYDVDIYLREHSYCLDPGGNRIYDKEKKGF